MAAQVPTCSAISITLRRTSRLELALAQAALITAVIHRRGRLHLDPDCREIAKRHWGVQTSAMVMAVDLLNGMTVRVYNWVATYTARDRVARGETGKEHLIHAIVADRHVGEWSCTELHHVSRGRMSWHGQHFRASL